MPSTARRVVKGVSFDRPRSPFRSVLGISALLATAFALIANSPHASSPGLVARAAERVTTVTPEATSDAWPIFRGNPTSDGVAASTLPDDPGLLWKRSFPGGAFPATVAIVDGTVYAGNYDGNLYALDLATGEEKWKYFSDLGYDAPPAVREGTVYIGDAHGVFHAIDAATGVARWKYTTKAEINAGANFHQDRVLFGSQDGTLYCFNADDGKLVWEYTIDDMIQCSPAVVEDYAFVAGCDGKLHVVDLNTGKAVRSISIEDPTGTTAAVVGDVAYFGTQGNVVLAVDWRQGEILWRFVPERRSPFYGSAAVKDGVVVLGGRDRAIHGLDATTGRQIWDVVVRRGVDSSPVIVGDRAYIGTGDGRLYGLELKSGDTVWEYEAGGTFTASPAVAGGRMVIGNDDGDLFCFGAK